MRWINRSRLAIATLMGGALLAGGAVPRSPMPADIPPTTRATPSPTPSLESPKHAAPEYFVMIDASHGGDDPGASLGPTRVPEKEVSLALARQLKHQLEERGVAARLLRDSDVNLSLEQRAALTNEEHAGLYIALHAGQPGRGIRVYSPALLMAQPPSAGRFLPWESAQLGSLPQSRLAATLVANELRKNGLTTQIVASPLRPLNNVVAPAIAVEWALGTMDPHSPQLQKLENMLASGIAAAILAARSQEGRGTSP
jgi:N-acetylmuramoyl-L-alanine amidase